MLSYITLDNLRLYAYHGVAPQEQLVGNEYLLNVRLQTDIRPAASTDDVAQAVNYASVADSIRQEMSQPSRLIEHVAMRIVRRLFADFPAVQALHLRLSKRNPPMGADIDSASVEISLSRSEVDSL